MPSSLLGFGWAIRLLGMQRLGVEGGVSATQPHDLEWVPDPGGAR